ncbi:MAG: hypothetical protein H7175_08875 [Burkholderiales bacterium]|nr:hypothetical protein [Anaerolineae bacterium]
MNRAIVPYKPNLPATRPPSALAISPRIQQSVAVAVMIVGVVALALQTAQRLSRAFKTRETLVAPTPQPIAKPQPSPIEAAFTPNPEHIRLEMRVQVVRVRRYIP